MAYVSNAGKDSLNVAPKMKQLLNEQAEFMKQHRPIPKK